MSKALVADNFPIEEGDGNVTRLLKGALQLGRVAAKYGGIPASNPAICGKSPFLPYEIPGMGEWAREDYYRLEWLTRSHPGGDKNGNSPKATGTNW